MDTDESVTDGATPVAVVQGKVQRTTFTRMQFGATYDTLREGKSLRCVEQLFENRIYLAGLLLLPRFDVEPKSPV